MTDAGVAPTPDLEVRIFEGPLLALREIEYDIRSAARLIGFSIWLASGIDGEQDDQILDPESIDFLPIRRIGYGSPIDVVVQVTPYVIGGLMTVLPVIDRLMRRIGQLRKDYAEASESNARRDGIREKTETRRAERESRQFDRRFQLLLEAAEDLLRNVDGEQARVVRHLVRQVQLDPRKLEDSVDALDRLSGKDVDMGLVPARRGRGDEIQSS